MLSETETIYRSDVRPKFRFAPAILLLGADILFLFTNNDSSLGVYHYFLPVVLSALFFLYECLNHKEYVLRWEGVLLIALFVIILLNLQIHRSSVNMGILGSYLVWFFFFFLASSRTYRRSELRFLKLCFVLSGIICALLILLQQVDYKNTGRSSIQWLGNEALDPNYLALYLCIPCLFAFREILFSRKWRRFFGLLAFVLMGLAIFQTGSRGAFLSLLVGGLILLLERFFTLRDARSKRKFILFFLLICLLFVLLLKLLLPAETFDRILHMQFFDASNTLRFSHWRAALQLSSRSLLIGFGAVDTTKLLMAELGYHGNAHNTYLTFLLQFGVIGLLMILGLLLYFCYHLIKRRNFEVLAVFLTVLAGSFIISNDIGHSFWLVLFLASASIHTAKEEETHGIA